MKKILLAVLLSALVGSVTLAAEGRVPVFQPTTITLEGHYIVTRNISLGAGNAIRIEADNVTVDLNGHLISKSTNDVPAIEIAPGFTNIAVLNGRISGGSRGISYASGTDRIRIRIDGVEIRNHGGHGIRIFGIESAEVTNCYVIGGGQGGIELNDSGPRYPGKVIGNIVRDTGNEGIFVENMRAGEVRGNEVTGHGSACGNCAAIDVGNGNGTLIAENKVAGTTERGMKVFGTGNKVLNNTISGAGRDGLTVFFSDNQLVGNVVENCNNGIVVGIGSTSPTRNMIDGNHLIDNSGFGIVFDGMSSNNAYRNNMMRGNGAGPVSGGGGINGNTNEGGNVCVGACP